MTAEVIYSPSSTSCEMPPEKYGLFCKPSLN